MNILNEVINRSYPGAELLCRECGGTDIVVSESNAMNAVNPMGERMMSIKCKKCGAGDDAVSENDVRETLKAWMMMVKEPALKPYQQGIKDEKRELDEKIYKLSDFIIGDEFLGVPGQERTRMRYQMMAMQAYSSILADRIEAFE